MRRVAKTINLVKVVGSVFILDSHLKAGRRASGVVASNHVVLHAQENNDKWSRDRAVAY
jgi:hypothetical protein